MISLSLDSLRYRFRTVISSSGHVTSVAPIENWSDQGFILRLSVTIDGLVERPGLLRQLGI